MPNPWSERPFWPDEEEESDMGGIGLEKEAAVRDGEDPWWKPEQLHDFSPRKLQTQEGGGSRGAHPSFITYQAPSLQLETRGGCSTKNPRTELKRVGQFLLSSFSIPPLPSPVLLALFPAHFSTSFAFFVCSV